MYNQPPTPACRQSGALSGPHRRPPPPPTGPARLRAGQKARRGAVRRVGDRRGAAAPPLETVFFASLTSYRTYGVTLRCAAPRSGTQAAWAGRVGRRGGPRTARPWGPRLGLFPFDHCMSHRGGGTKRMGRPSEQRRGQGELLRRWGQSAAEQGPVRQGKSIRGDTAGSKEPERRDKKLTRRGSRGARLFAVGGENAVRGKSLQEYHQATYTRKQKFYLR